MESHLCYKKELQSDQSVQLLKGQSGHGFISQIKKQEQKAT